MNRINDLMLRHSLRAIIITDRYNMNYLSGYMGDAGMLLFMDDKQYVLTDSRYTEIAQKQATCFECIDVKSEGYSKTLYRLIVRCLCGQNREYVDAESKKIETCVIGFEDENISYKQFKAFESVLSDFELRPLRSSIDELRQIKSDEEITKIAKAEAIGDEAFAHIVEWIKPGMTEQEIALELEVAMRKLGATGLSFDTIAASGPNSSMPHAVPTDRRLQAGDFLTMDFGCIYDGYCSDMTRTIFISGRERYLEPTEKQMEVYNTVLKAQLEAIKLIKPGARCSDVDACARNIIKDAGYGDYFGHGLGHSVGLFIHEEPRLSPKCDTILEPGMIVTVEPGIYLPGEFGVRIEDLVVVKEDGCRNLTCSPKKLIKI